MTSRMIIVAAIFSILTSPSAAQLGDFNNDGQWDILDLDRLTNAAATMSTDLTFDMNGDAAINLADIRGPGVGWLAVAGNINVAYPYGIADATLDGQIDGADFLIWDANKLSATGEWSQGDFNADGFSDVQDLIDWQQNQFSANGNGYPVTQAVSGVPGDFVPDLYFDPSCGLLTLDTDGVDFSVAIISGPDLTQPGNCVLCQNTVLPPSGFVQTAFFNGTSSWTTSLSTLPGPVGVFDLAVLGPGMVDFPAELDGFNVRFATTGDPFGQFYTNVTVVSYSPTHTWTGASDVNWSNPANWMNNGGSVGIPMSSTDQVQIPGGTAQAFLDISTNVGRLDLAATASLTFGTGSTLTMTRCIINDGAIQLNDSGTLLFDSTAFIAGSGVVEMTNTSAVIDTSTDLFLGDAIVTNFTNHAIRGTGSIPAALINDGTVNANIAGQALLLHDKDKTNRGILSASGGGTLRISGINLMHEGGNIEADGGTVVVQDDAQITGGTIQGDDVEFGNATLIDVSFGAGTQSQILSGQTLNFAGSNIAHQGDLVAEGTLLTNPGLDLTNNGTMKASTGGMLQFIDTKITNANATSSLFADGGNVILSDGTEVIAGQLKSDGNSIESQTAKLTDVRITSGSQVSLRSTHVLTISGSGITNDGTIDVLAGDGIIAFDTTGSLDGSGSVVMSGNSPNVALEVTTGNTMTHAAGHDVRGSGNVFGDIVNLGTVSANEAGTTLVVDPDGSALGSPSAGARFDNRRTLRAELGGMLHLSGNGSGQFSNSGTIEALNGSSVISTNAVITQISSSTVAGGTYRAIDMGSGATLDVAQPDYEPENNQGVIETYGVNASNDVLGVKVGNDHTNSKLLQNDGTIILGGGANLVVTDSLLDAVVSTGEIVVGQGSRLDVTDRVTTFPVVEDSTDAGLRVDGGTLRGSGTIDGGVYMPAGTLEPGDAPMETGLLSILGDFNMDDPKMLIEEAKTTIELGGYTRGDQYDSFDATGDFFGQGTLRGTLVDGFLPNIGDEFIVATYVEDGNLPGNLWDNYEFNRVQFGLVDRDLGGMNRETVLTVIDVRDIDFNQDTSIDCEDVDALVADIAAGTNTSEFDLNFDGLVDHEDLNIWLTDAGAINLSSRQPYLPADANLDGVVDGVDFIAWNENKFTATAAFCAGDFNADGLVDGQDFIIWNRIKFTSSGIETIILPAPGLDGSHAVPEPGALAMLALISALVTFRRRA